MFFRLVFFFKQETAYEMRISYWSSDVCSSDLLDAGGAGRTTADDRHRGVPQQQGFAGHVQGGGWTWRAPQQRGIVGVVARQQHPRRLDRKSTRLNSSH